MTDTDRSLTLHFTVPATHPCLPGHFPGRPIVPAVVIVDLAVAALRRARPALALTGISGFKFLAPLEPDVAVVAHFAFTADGARLRCSAGERTLCEGRLQFGAPR